MCSAMRARAASKSRNVRVRGSAAVAVMRVASNGLRVAVLRKWLFLRRGSGALDLDQSVRHHECGDGDGRARRRIGWEELAVYRVHRLEIGGLGEKHRALRHIFHLRARERECRLYVLERLTSLTFDAAVGKPATARLRAHHSGQKDDVTDAYGGRKHAARASIGTVDDLLVGGALLLLRNQGSCCKHRRCGECEDCEAD